MRLEPAIWLARIDRLLSTLYRWLRPALRPVLNHSGQRVAVGTCRCMAMGPGLPTAGAVHSAQKCV